MSDKPRARRCSECDTNWPNTSTYDQCPRGCGSTWIAGDQEPVTHAEADRIKKLHERFAQYCKERDSQIAMLDAMMNPV